MLGPGEYVPDPTEGIVDIKNLPRPHLVAYSRHHDHTPCPRCSLWPIATKLASARYMTWAICPPAVRLISS